MIDLIKKFAIFFFFIGLTGTLVFGLKTYGSDLEYEVLESNLELAQNAGKSDMLTFATLSVFALMILVVDFMRNPRL
ncbi:MAG: hypothetical protein KTR26_20145 [Flammeovirgaceae bacterium]|nr:hypothetical protein [Flammeovirgaceae bacterium]